MRPELELMERIEQYLSGELSPADKTAFESQLAVDASLREAVKLQKDIRFGLERASLRGAIHRAKQHFYRRIWYRWGGLGLGVVVALVAIFLSTHHDRRFTVVPGMPAATHGEIYTIDCRHDTLLRTAHGAMINIPRGSIDASGANTVRIEIKEAYTIAAMLRFGLLTQSDGHPLSSGGMIDIRPADGSSAKIIRSINVALPTLRVEEKMQRFKGVMDDKGKINWIDPHPLADSFTQKAVAYGKSIFEANCRSCHSLRSSVTGPALAYVGQRRSEEWLYDFIRNNNKVLVSGDCYANYIYNVYNKTVMNTFPDLNHTDIRCLIDYITSESQLIDSNQVPNYTRELDSCLRYKRLASALEKNRDALIRANGPRTQVIRHDDTGAIITDTVVVYASPASVTPIEHPSLYYQFTVESFGWYNVDALLKDLPGVLPSKLLVQMTPEYAAEVNVFLVLPGRKIFTEGGFLKDSKTEFGFFTEDGQIPLPQSEQAYVFATGEYHGKPVFAVCSFITTQQQAINLQPAPMSKEQITETISHLDLNHLAIRVADSRNAVRIRAIDTSLAKIAPLKPQHCDCDCGMGAQKAAGDTAVAGYMN
ncbi:MAG TPA: cytochrome c [Puia sp.]|nr:cytochrome c [Puia sp.]